MTTTPPEPGAPGGARQVDPEPVDTDPIDDVHGDVRKVDTSRVDTGPGDASRADPASAGSRQVDIGQAGAVQADGGQAGAEQADAGQADAAQHGAVQADAVQADPGSADSRQGDRKQPGAGQADAGQADGAQASPAQTDPMQPNPIPPDPASGGGAARIRVLLADDEPMVRAGIGAILRTDPEIELAAECADGREAVERARALRPDVVLMDIRMPRLDGLDATAELRRALPDLPVVILTTFDEDAYVARALSEGARGFLLKAADPRELLIGVRAAAEGAAYLSPRIAERVIARMRGGHLTRADRAGRQISALTPRERDVLALLGRGLSNQHIATRLHLAEGTVKAHVSSILTQLDAENRVQAAITAHEAGLTGET